MQMSECTRRGDHMSRPAPKQRWERVLDKRFLRDPFYGIGTVAGPPAPVKGAMCRCCKRRYIPGRGA